MVPILIDGKALSLRIEQDIGEEVKGLTLRYGRAPGLAVILVGENPASKAYVANKEKCAARCGFKTFNHKLPENATPETLRDVIISCNENLNIDGILLQLPLPKHLNSNYFLSLIKPEKDADGLHPFNQGLLMRGEGVLRPCTPMGSMRLIDLAFLMRADSELKDIPSVIPEVDLAGKEAVIVGRSILVGKPIALLLLERNATVTIAHSKTPALPDKVRSADIVIAAVGQPSLVRGDWIKPGAIVIDVGINRLASGELTGDVAFNEALQYAGAITPVPKGVGPMTVVMLMKNTLEAYRTSFSLRNN